MGMLVRASKARILLTGHGRRWFMLLRGPGGRRVFPWLSNGIHSLALMFLLPSFGGQGEPGQPVGHGRRVGRQGRDHQCKKNFVYRHVALLSKGAARARTLLARARHSITSAGARGCARAGLPAAPVLGCDRERFWRILARHIGASLGCVEAHHVAHGCGEPCGDAIHRLQGGACLGGLQPDEIASASADHEGKLVLGKPLFHTN